MSDGRVGQKYRKYFGNPTCKDLKKALYRKVEDIEKQSKRAEAHRDRATESWHDRTKYTNRSSWYGFFSVNIDEKVTVKLDKMTKQMEKDHDTINSSIKTLSNYDYKQDSECIITLTKYNDFMREAVQRMKFYADDFEYLSSDPNSGSSDPVASGEMVSGLLSFLLD